MKAPTKKALFGRKRGMTRIFTEDGRCLPVTVIELGPNVVHQVKSQQNDGYDAIQVGFGVQKIQRVNRALTGHFAKAKKGMPEVIGEIRFEDSKGDAPSYEVGQELTVDGMFEPGQRVDVTGTSIGKGFAGVMKRHGMKGAQTVSHGTHEYKRHAGSIGCRKFPGRVFKNKRMAGHMGNTRVTQQGIEIVSVRPEDNAVLLHGSVPGAKGSVVFVRDSVKQ